MNDPFGAHFCMNEVVVGEGGGGMDKVGLKDILSIHKFENELAFLLK